MEVIFDRNGGKKVRFLDKTCQAIYDSPLPLEEKARWAKIYRLSQRISIPQLNLVDGKYVDNPFYYYYERGYRRWTDHVLTRYLASIDRYLLKRRRQARRIAESVTSEAGCGEKLV